MKKNTTIWLLLLALCSIFSSCKKDNTTPEEQLPPETQTGAYTLGFKVDGVIYKASGKPGLLSAAGVYYSYFSSDSSFNIGASGSDKNFSLSLTFKCSALNTPCPLVEYYPLGVIFQDDATIPGNSNVYRTNNIYSGTATVKYFNGTFAPGNFGTIVSGTFQMDCVNANGKVIKITEGRFDTGR